MRGTFANIRLKNEMAPGTEGGVTRLMPDGTPMSIYDASMKYQKQGVPLVVFAGKEYGTGSSRDWAAKGTVLLGIKAVIAESFERIHRSNLVGMGVLPLQFKGDMTRKTLNLDGSEVFDITGMAAGLKPRMDVTLRIIRAGGTQEVSLVLPHRYPGRDRVFQERRHPAVRAAQPDEGGVRHIVAGPRALRGPATEITDAVQPAWTNRPYPQGIDWAGSHPIEFGHLGVFVTGGRGPIPAQALLPTYPFDHIERSILTLPKASDIDLRVRVPRPDVSLRWLNGASSSTAGAMSTAPNNISTNTS